jgi:oxygen-independent coproporphyrinogen-3 oxidase
LVPEVLPPKEALRDALQGEPLGLYVHIPFCVDRCTYCSFVTTCDHSRKPEVLARLEDKLAVWGQALGKPEVDTLYLGGGTPSVLNLEELGRLTNATRSAFDLASLREATLEANPGTVDPEWLQGARRLGWNRISLGVQTLDDRLLQRLGRIHDAREGLAALRQARAAGFERVSADLMLGIPGQNLSRVLADARQISITGANHLSIYMLDLDKACPLKRDVDSGRLTLPAEEETAEAFEALQEELPELGFEAYEISNYAQIGQQSIHNNRYWERRPYLGLGPSAASHLGSCRWSEPSDFQSWLETEDLQEFQVLDPAGSLAEIPLLGLRRLCGIDWQELHTLAASQGLLPLVTRWEQELAPFFQHGLLIREGPILRFSRKGLLLSNAVFEVFV